MPRVHGPRLSGSIRSDTDGSAGHPRPLADETARTSTEGSNAVSYSTNRRDALDANQPIAHRMSHARSCAVHVSQKYRVERGLILDLVHRACGVDLNELATDQELGTAVAVLDQMKANGIDEPPEDDRPPWTTE